MIKKNCVVCGKEFETQNKNAKYCSHKCTGIGQRKNNVFICDYCKKEFTDNNRQKDRKYCSQRCFHKSQKIYNTYIEKSDHIEVIIQNDKFGDKTVLIDKEDYDKIKNYNWHLQYGQMKHYTIFYAGTMLNRKTVRMHRLIMDFPKGKVIDHINHNGLDNRKSNLRICSTAQNNLNKIPKKEYPGITKEIHYRYKVVHRGQYLGTYKYFEDAYNVKKVAENQDSDKDYFYMPST